MTIFRYNEDAMNLFAIIGTVFILFCAYRLVRIIWRKEVMVSSRWWTMYHWEPADGRTGKFVSDLVMSALLLAMALAVVVFWTASGAARWS